MRSFIAPAFLLSAFAFQAITALPVAHIIDDLGTPAAAAPVVGAVPVVVTAPAAGTVPTVPVVGTTASNPATPPTGGITSASNGGPAVSGPDTATCDGSLGVLAGVVCGNNILDGPIAPNLLAGAQVLNGNQIPVDVAAGILGQATAALTKPELNV